MTVTVDDGEAAALLGELLVGGAEGVFLAAQALHLVAQLHELDAAAKARHCRGGRGIE